MGSNTAGDKNSPFWLRSLRGWLSVTLDPASNGLLASFAFDSPVTGDGRPVATALRRATLRFSAAANRSFRGFFAKDTSIDSQ